MKYSLLSIAVLASSCSPAEVEQSKPWVSFPIDNQVTVQLPATPLEMPASALAPFISDNPQASKAKAFITDDQAGTYVIVTVPMDPRLELQLPREIKPADRTPYYRRYVELLLTKTKGELLHQSLRTEGNVDFLTIKYRAPSPWLRISEQKYLDTFMLTRTHTLYQLYFTPKDEAGNTYAAQCLRFFNVTIPKEYQPRVH
ncbi:hypothetical protein [Hymenobacter cavernae]|uniref:hypothetical protein n=1 Tax=Hymenobacter cavernae TaxID=2044852 RepID=UPI001663CE06|nr:hypothetical protein [Hymenobacter cavernae]